MKTSVAIKHVRSGLRQAARDASSHIAGAVVLVAVLIAASTAAHAAFSREAASRGIVDSVCFSPRKPGPVDGGAGGAIVASAQPTQWVMTATATLHARDAEEQEPKAGSVSVELTGPVLTQWNTFLDNRVVPAFKAKYSLP